MTDDDEMLTPVERYDAFGYYDTASFDEDLENFPDLFDFYGWLSTAATKCARWRRKSVPVGLREKGRKALVSFIAARIEACGA